MSNLQSIKKKLLSRKKDLETTLFQDYKGKQVDEVQDTADQAFSSSLEDISISLHNNELEEYNMIRKALDMIESGTYGICSECNNPISEKRLMMYPNATRCVSCQEALEEGRL